jgi:hypothetical protein
MDVCSICWNSGEHRTPASRLQHTRAPGTHVHARILRCLTTTGSFSGLYLTSLNTSYKEQLTPYKHGEPISWPRHPTISRTRRALTLRPVLHEQAHATGSYWLAPPDTWRAYSTEKKNSNGLSLKLSEKLCQRKAPKLKALCVKFEASSLPEIQSLQFDRQSTQKWRWTLLRWWWQH